MKIREALRLKSLGMKHSQIANSGTLNLARSTVIELLQRCENHSLTYLDTKELSDSELEAILYPRKGTAAANRRTELNEAAWLKRIHETGLDRRSIWEEYIAEHPDGISYGQFCRRLKEFEGLSTSALSYPKQRKPGLVMETDWAGDTLAIVFDADTNSMTKVHFFVASIGISQKIFAYATPDEKAACWIQAHSKALEFYGAVPAIVTPDNAKTAVVKSNRYEPQKSPVYQMWVEHYGVAIHPARVRKPKDKDRVEANVNIVVQKILPKLASQIFYDFESLNAQILVFLEKLNKKPYQKRPGNRTDMFNAIDLPAMKPLPTTAFEVRIVKEVAVSRNGYHVSFESHMYSAPYQLAGQTVRLVASSSTVELLYDNKRVALHPRHYGDVQYYSTDPNHMPEHHQAQFEMDTMNGFQYRAWAKSIGPYTLKVIEYHLAQHDIEEQVYPTCMGIMRLATKQSPFVVEMVMKQAVDHRIYTYHAIKTMLDARIQDIDKSRTAHENIRGADYYKEF